MKKLTAQYYRTQETHISLPFIGAGVSIGIVSFTLVEFMLNLVDTAHNIVKTFGLARATEFSRQIRAYWRLKRESRHGAPLIRRLSVCLLL